MKSMQKQRFPIKVISMRLWVISGKQKPPEAAGDKSRAFGHQQSIEDHAKSLNNYEKQ